MAAAGRCPCSDLHMTLPNREALLLPYTTQPPPFPFPCLQRLSIPFKAARPCFLPPSSVSSSTFFRSLPRSRLSTLPSLLHLVTSLADTAATSSFAFRLSFLSSQRSVFSVPENLHSDGFSIFLCPRSSSFCHGSLPQRNYLGILSRCDRQDAHQNVIEPSRGLRLAATCRCPSR